MDCSTASAWLSCITMQLGECGPLGLKSVIPTAREVAAQAPGSLRVVLDHVRASLLLALGSPGADGMFNRLELMLPLFWWVCNNKAGGHGSRCLGAGGVAAGRTRITQGGAYP